MSTINTIGSFFDVSKVGSGWQPRTDRIRVGRDVGALTATTFDGKAARNIVLGSGDAVSLKSVKFFEEAKLLAQQGYAPPASFRSMEQKSPVDDSLGGAVIQKKGDYTVVFGKEDGVDMLSILKKNASTGEYEKITSVSGKQDVRVTWDSNDEPRILTGRAALTNGNLTAEGANEVLFRQSGVNVVAGEGTIVLNTSSSAGTYSGGNNVTYLGMYQGGTFTKTNGAVTFAGYFSEASFSELTGKSAFSGVFEGASIDVAKGDGSFSGFFSASQVQTGNNGSMVNGLFLNGCIVQGGDGEDIFSGRFIDSKVNGGKGDDHFGHAPSMTRKEKLSYLNYKGEVQEFEGLAADFVNSTISAGEGDDQFQGTMVGGSLDLEQGKDHVLGVFDSATVNGGDGDDTLAATYSHSSFFDTGLGDNSVNLTTAVQSMVTTDEGKNIVSLGKNNHTEADSTWQTEKEYALRMRPSETGELQRNIVDSEKGDTTVDIHNGESTRTIDTNNADEKKQVEEKTLSEEPGKDDHLSAASLSPELLTPSTPELFDDEKASSNRTVRRVTDLYQGMLSRESLTGENFAASVTDSVGNSQTVYGIERHNTFEEDNNGRGGMVQTKRHSEGNGVSSWKRWMGIRDK